MTGISQCRSKLGKKSRCVSIGRRSMFCVQEIDQRQTFIRLSHDMDVWFESTSGIFCLPPWLVGAVLTACQSLSRPKVQSLEFSAFQTPFSMFVFLNDHSVFKNGSPAAEYNSNCLAMGGSPAQCINGEGSTSVTDMRAKMVMADL